MYRLRCTPHPQSWVFFQKFQNKAFVLPYYSACKKPTAMVFMWGGKGYPSIHLNKKLPLRDINYMADI